jgi:hypothetical protein
VYVSISPPQELHHSPKLPLVSQFSWRMQAQTLAALSIPSATVDAWHVHDWALSRVLAQNQYF